MIYLLDANAISDLLTRQGPVLAHLREALLRQDTLAVCRPIHYELLRGLLWRGATTKLAILNQRILPQFTWVPLQDTDWKKAAQFWADARRQGRQLSDPDLLLAALADRMGSTIVSNDTDFDILPIRREDWRV